MRCTPTDPSLEFDVFEMAKLRLAEVLDSRGYDLIRAERTALYVVEGIRPAAKLLKVLTRVKPPADDEVVEALRSLLDEAPALVKVERLLLGSDSGEEAV